MGQNKALLVGVTGGIGSGKSIVCKVFQTLGVPVYDADSKARWLMESDPNLINAIKNEFGEQSYVHNELQREYLAKIVFPNPEKLKILNALTHPAVAIDFEKWVTLNSNSPYLVKEAALFIESGSYKFLDKIILVTAPDKIKIERVLKRDKHRTEQEVKSIIERQFPDSEKRVHCDYEIVNDGSIPILQQIIDLNKEFKKL